MKTMKEKSIDRERSYRIENRCSDAITILGTMTVATALICCFGPWMPEQLLITAAITMACSGLGVMIFAVIRLGNALERLDSM